MSSNNSTETLHHFINEAIKRYMEENDRAIKNFVADMATTIVKGLIESKVLEKTSVADEILVSPGETPVLAEGNAIIAGEKIAREEGPVITATPHSEATPAEHTIQAPANANPTLPATDTRQLESDNDLVQTNAKIKRGSGDMRPEMGKSAVMDTSRIRHGGVDRARTKDGWGNLEEEGIAKNSTGQRLKRQERDQIEEKEKARKEDFEFLDPQTKARLPGEEIKSALPHTRGVARTAKELKMTAGRHHTSQPTSPKRTFKKPSEKMSSGGDTGGSASARQGTMRRHSLPIATKARNLDEGRGWDGAKTKTKTKTTELHDGSSEEELNTKPRVKSANDFKAFKGKQKRGRDASGGGPSGDEHTAKRPRQGREKHN